MKSESSTVEAVDAVELRIERRRADLVHDWNEALAYVERKNRWTPLAALAGMAALGFGLTRVRPTQGRATAYSAGARRGGVLAALAATIGGAVRFALSPTGRALWASVNRRRGGVR